MSWADASPVLKIVHPVKAGIDIAADGRAKLNITFSEPFFRELGEPKAMNIQAGKDDNLGMIRLVPAADGAFAVREYGRGGGSVQMILPAGITPRNREIEPCEIVERPKGAKDAGVAALLEDAAWIVRLPLQAWDRQGGAAPMQPAKTQVQTPPAPKVAVASPTHTSTRPLNAADYLKKKGIRCARLAGEWWQLENERVPRIEILGRVNELRRRDDLPALAIDQIE